MGALTDAAGHGADALDGFLAAAQAAADAARTVVRPLFRSRLTAHAKADDSPVTVADRETERTVRAVLEAAYPDHGLIGEEHGRLRDDARLRWVIDPIDGTRAFITGRPSFGTLIALLDGDDPILGLIDQPITGERWLGVAGRPTRFTGPLGGQVGVRPCASIDRAELSCTAPDMVTGPGFERWDALARGVRRVSWGGDCYAYGLLALGQIDIVAEGTLKLWDWAALQPIVEGAGGRLVDWTGARLRPDSDGRVLAVGDPALLEPVLDILNYSNE